MHFEVGSLVPCYSTETKPPDFALHSTEEQKKLSWLSFEDFFLFGRGVTAPWPWELVPRAKIEEIPKMFSLGLQTSAPDFSLSVRGRRYWEVEFYFGQQCFTNLGQCEAALTAELCLKAGEKYHVMVGISGSLFSNTGHLQQPHRLSWCTKWWSHVPNIAGPAIC